MALDQNGNGNNKREWRDDRKLVLHELDRLNIASEKHSEKYDKCTREIEKRIMSLHTEIVRLKTKASVWGSILGAVWGAISAIIFTALRK